MRTRKLLIRVGTCACVAVCSVVIIFFSFEYFETKDLGDWLRAPYHYVFGTSSPNTDESEYVHMGWRAQIARELTLWTHITVEDFFRFERSLQESNFYGVRIVILKGQVYYKTIKQEPNPHAGHTIGYTLSTLLAMKQLVHHARVNGWRLHDQKGVVFHIQYGDGCSTSTDASLPVFGFNNAPGIGTHLGNTCKHTVGFPSYDWWWPLHFSRMDSAMRIPWSEKKPVLLFRGNLNSWDGMRTAVLWSSIQHPELIDGKLTTVNPDVCDVVMRATEVWGLQRPDGVDIAENCSNIIGDHYSPADFARFKYWLDVDGHGASFRLKNYLTGDSVIFKVESEYYQHFHTALQPWVHYIPVSKSNFAPSIVERVTWAREHDAECQAMVHRTRTWAKIYLTHHQTAWYQAELVSQLRSKLYFEPSVHDMNIVCCSDFYKAIKKKIWGSSRRGESFDCRDAAPWCGSKTGSRMDLKSMRHE